MIVFLGFGRLYYYLTDDFRISNIVYDMRSEKGWGFPRLSVEDEMEIASKLNQKYCYIGKGAQCYAFESSDHLYVLKFFKFKHLTPNWFIRLLPDMYPFNDIKESVAIRKQKKLHVVFDGHELAYRENKKTSELLYLHIKPTDYLHQTVTVVDKLGFEHDIDLDHTVFLLQLKGEKLRTVMSRFLEAGDVSSAKLAIAKIFDMYVSEYHKGLYDGDPGVMHNTGFINGQPFHLDVGKLRKDNRMHEPDVYRKDLERVAWKMDLWIKNSYPHYYSELSSFIANEYLSHTGHIFDVLRIDPALFKKKR